MFLYQTSFEALTGLPELIGYIALFVFGGVIGSFLNVVIHRVPREESIVFPNSTCPKCGNAIKPYDNIPIVSWLVLRGKCRKCGEKISARYPAVELLSALLFMVVGWSVGFTVFLPVALIFTVTIVALVFIDAEHMLLPDVLTFPLLGFALLSRLIFSFVPNNEVYFSDVRFYPLTQLSDSPAWLVALLAALLGGLVGGGSLWLVGEIWKRLRGVDAMGLGDVKLMFGVGALLGWRLTVLTIFLGAFTGALVGVIVIARSKDKDMQAKIPFGIFLGIGALVSLLFGEQIIRWYVETFIP